MKLTISLPGIGPILSKKLKLEGYEYSYQLLGIFLVLNKDKELFIEWLELTISATVWQATKCANCLEEWCDEYL